MAATQSHAAELLRMRAERYAWPGHLDEVLGAQRGAVQCMYTSVIVGIVEVAAREARRKLSSAPKLHAYEQVEWTRARQEAWLTQQAFEGMLRGMDNPKTSASEALLAKIAIAELAESTTQRMSRVVGGGAFSRNSPFGSGSRSARLPATVVGTGIRAGLCTCSDYLNTTRRPRLPHCRQCPAEAGLRHQQVKDGRPRLPLLEVER